MLNLAALVALAVVLRNRTQAAFTVLEHLDRVIVVVAHLVLPTQTVAAVAVVLVLLAWTGQAQALEALAQHG